LPEDGTVSFTDVTKRISSKLHQKIMHSITPQPNQSVTSLPNRYITPRLLKGVTRCFTPQLLPKEKKSASLRRRQDIASREESDVPEETLASRQISMEEVSTTEISASLNSLIGVTDHSNEALRVSSGCNSIDEGIRETCHKTFQRAMNAIS
jgi:hypothetical protein